ncbi:MAG: class I SAM-dependent RNA methyltransferase [Anaerolineae bacterium]|nr:class I SAM-dependent RNA methyltransferase [Anaerolineae bacterium]MDW7992677.1 class I SAM-dependent RNA methyltransferase [Anaerolineae bacterium]
MEILISLTGIAHGGAAFGRHEGKVVFVPYALPGETVRAEVVEDHRHYAHARLLEVVEASPDRVSPPCPYFGPEGCGGCHWQHAAYEAQLRMKAQVVMDQLSRIGGILDPSVRPTIPDPSGWSYRNQARFHPAPEGGLGFYVGESRAVVPIENCLILHPLLADLYDAVDLELPGLRALTLRAGVATGERMLILETEDDEPPILEIDIPVSCVLLRSDGALLTLIGTSSFTEIVAGRRYRVSAPSFFQANTHQAGELVRLVLEYLDLTGEETVLDGYCGVGLFTVPLAERAGLVIAVESDPYAVEDLLVNTEGMENVEVVEGPIEAVLPDVEEHLDAAVVDPPRTGMTPEALEGLIRLAPEQLVYVSCDPATLARDARRLAEAGYRLVEVQPVDMFPQTYHIETVSLWRKEDTRM